VVTGRAARAWLDRHDRWIARLAGTSEPARGELPAWRTLALVIGFVAFWRLAIVALATFFGRLGIVTCGVGVEAPWRYSACWDTQTYQIIAARGYDYTPDAPSSVAFFPAFPLLMRYANNWLPGPGDVKAAVIANGVLLLLATLYVFLLIRIDFGESIAWRSLAFLLAFPSAFFFTAAYPEVLFLFALAGSLYHARRGQWLLAGLFGALASAAKFIGILLIVPLVIELLAQRRHALRTPSSLGVLLAPLGALGYFAWLQWRFGDFRAFFEAQQNWTRESGESVFFMGVSHLLGDSATAETYYPASTTPIQDVWIVFDTTLLWLFIAAGVVLWLRVRPSYGALVLAPSLALGFSGNPQSLNRYLVVLFPAFILLAMIRSEPVRNALLMLFAMGLMVTAMFFVGSMWAG
jgi:hypothetical protein